MKEFLGKILMAEGIFIAGASGLCTLFFIVTLVIERSWATPWLSDLPLLALVSGSIPLSIGVALVFAGRALIRSARKRKN